MLGVGGGVRLSVRAEAQLDHLPVALVQAHEQEGLVVVVLKEPVLKPESTGSVVHGMAVDLVGVAWASVHLARVDDVLLSTASR